MKTGKKIIKKIIQIKSIPELMEEKKTQDNEKKQTLITYY